eukprot:10169985-Alexandrium_andersonii.AAC.1
MCAARCSRFAPVVVSRGALTGVLAMPPLPAALAEAAGHDDPQLPPQAALLPEAPRCAVWSDGAC